LLKPCSARGDARPTTAEREVVDGQSEFVTDLEWHARSLEANRAEKRFFAAR
jgi:hypothetical protein